MEASKKPFLWNKIKPRLKKNIFAPFLLLEWGLEWTVFYLKKWALVDILDIAAKFTILVAVVGYLFGAENRKKEQISQNWLVLTNAKQLGGGAMGIDALNNLVKLGAPINGIDLNNLYLEGVFLENTVLRKVNLSESKLAKANLNGTSFKEADLRGIDLRGAEIMNVTFDSTNLASGDLRGTNLKKCSFRNSSLKGVNLRNADLRGVRFYNTDLMELELNWSKVSSVDWLENLMDSNNEGDSIVYQNYNIDPKSQLDENQNIYYFIRKCVN